MKVLLWVVPSAFLIRYSGRNLLQTTFGTQARHALIWGIGAGLILGIGALIQKYLAHHNLLVHLNWGFLNAIIVAPLVEEFTFRGAVLGNLVGRYRFGVANAITALLFLGSHFPGWYFQGTLSKNLTQLFGGALSIFILGLVFGYVVLKSRSVVGGVIAHSINNLFSMF